MGSNLSMLAFEILGVRLAHLNHSWEHPGKQGIGCNVVSANDTTNFLSFLQMFRSMSVPGLIISAAVSVNPFVGPDGVPTTDVSGFGQALDYIGSSFDAVNLIQSSNVARQKL